MARPLLLGKRLTLNPVAILIGLILMWEIWGVAGAFISLDLARADWDEPPVSE